MALPGAPSTAPRICKIYILQPIPPLITIVLVRRHPVLPGDEISPPPPLPCLPLFTSKVNESSMGLPFRRDSFCKQNAYHIPKSNPQIIRLYAVGKIIRGGGASIPGVMTTYGGYFYVGMFRTTLYWQEQKRESFPPDQETAAMEGD